MAFQERDVESFGDIPAPATKSHSALLAAEKPWYQVGLMAQNVIPGLGTKESRKNMAEKLETIDSVLNDPRFGKTQQAFDWVSDIGSSLLPTAPLGIVGGLAVRGVGVAVGLAARSIAPIALTSFARQPLYKLAGTALSKYLPREGAIRTSQAAINLAESYGFYKGFTIPEHIVANYHKENDVLDYRHAIKDWSSDNFGFLLGSVPFVGGYIAYKGIGNVIKARIAEKESNALTSEIGKLLREHEAIRAENEENATLAKEYVGKVSELQRHLGQAVEEGHITPEEHDWYLDYLFNPDDEENLLKSGMEILRKSGIPYDRVTGNIWFPLMERNDIKNLKGAIQDEVATNFTDEERQALSAYIVHNRMDAIRTLLAENPNMVHGLRGYTDFIESKLGKRAKVFEALDKIITENLPKGLGKKELFSQNNIYKHLKKIGIHDITQVPFTVPEGVAFKLELARKIDKILARKGARYEQWYREGLHLKLKEQLKAIKLLTPKEELEHLKEMLLPKGKLASNVRNKKAYHRLEELSQLWANAKHLLDRIHMEQEYEKQAAFNKVLQRFVDVVDSNAARFADPSRVTRYLQKRIETEVPYSRQFEPLATLGNREIGETIGQDVIAENTRVVEASDFSGLKELVQEQTAKISQLQEHGDALSDLINCALGG